MRRILKAMSLTSAPCQTMKHTSKLTMESVMITSEPRVIMEIMVLMDTTLLHMITILAKAITETGVLQAIIRLAMPMVMLKAITETGVLEDITQLAMLMVMLQAITVIGVLQAITQLAMLMVMLEVTMATGVSVPNIMLVPSTIQAITPDMMCQSVMAMLATDTLDTYTANGPTRCLPMRLLLLQLRIICHLPT